MKTIVAPPLDIWKYLRDGRPSVRLLELHWCTSSHRLLTESPSQSSRCIQMYYEQIVSFNVNNRNVRDLGDATAQDIHRQNFQEHNTTLLHRPTNDLHLSAAHSAGFHSSCRPSTGPPSSSLAGEHREELQTVEGLRWGWQDLAACRPLSKSLQLSAMKNK